MWCADVILSYLVPGTWYQGSSVRACFLAQKNYLVNVYVDIIRLRSQLESCCCIYQYENQRHKRQPIAGSLAGYYHVLL